MLPKCPTHWALAVHFPHCPAPLPDKVQNGSPIDPQASVAVEPKSPLHMKHVDEDVSHTGSALGQSDAEVHWTQAWVTVLQDGVAPEHCVSDVHATQRPGFDPVTTQRVDRQSTAPFATVQGPSPMA